MSGILPAASAHHSGRSTPTNEARADNSQLANTSAAKPPHERIVDEFFALAKSANGRINLAEIIEKVTSEDERGVEGENIASIVNNTLLAFTERVVSAQEEGKKFQTLLAQQVSAQKPATEARISFDSEIDRLALQLEKQLEEKTQALETLTKQLAAQKKESESQVNTLQAQIAESLNSVSDQQREITALKEQLTTVKSEKTKIESELNESRAQQTSPQPQAKAVQPVDDQTPALQTRISELEGALRQKDNLFNGLTQKIKDAQQNIGDQGSELNSLREQLAQQESQAKSLETTQQQLAEAKTRIEALQAEVETLRMQPTEQEDKFEDASAEYPVTAQLDEAKQQLDKLNTEKAQLMASLATLEAANNKLQGQLNQQSASMRSGAEQNEKLQAEIAQLKLQIARQVGEIERVSALHDMAAVQTAQDAKHQIETLNAQLREAQQALEKLKANLLDKAALSQLLRDTWGASSNEDLMEYALIPDLLGNEYGLLKPQDIQARQAEITQLKENIATAQAQIKQQLATITALQQQLENKTAATDQATRELATVKATLAAMQTENSKSADKISALEAAQRTLQTQFDAKDQSAQWALAASASLEGTIQQLKTEVSGLKTQLAQQIAEANRASEQLRQQLVKQQSLAQTTEQSLHQQVAQLTAQLRQQSAELTKMPELQNMVQQLRQLQQPQNEAEQHLVQVNTLTEYLDAISPLWYTAVSAMLPHIAEENQRTFCEVMVGGCLQEIKHQDDQLTLQYKNKQNPEIVEHVAVPIIPSEEGVAGVSALCRLMVLRSAIHACFKPQSHDAQIACTGVIKDGIQGQYCFIDRYNGAYQLKQELSLPEIKNIIMRFNLLAELGGFVVVSRTNSKIRFDCIQQECIRRIVDSMLNPSLEMAESAEAAAGVAEEVMSLKQQLAAQVAQVGALQRANLEARTERETELAHARAEINQLNRQLDAQTTAAQAAAAAIPTIQIANRKIVRQPCEVFYISGKGTVKQGQLLTSGDGRTAFILRGSESPKQLPLTQVYATQAEAQAAVAVAVAVKRK